jgi:hypothetical protein
MAIDMASVYAAKYRKQPDMLRAAVMGQSPDASLDSYTALNALRLIKEADMMAMAGQAQQPTSAPSLVAQNMAPPPMQQGLGAMVPGAMGQTPQGMPPQGQAPQQPMRAASGGLAGMYTPEEDYAAGGIVAFSEPTEENNYSLVRTEYGDSNRFSPFAKGDDDVDADTDGGGTPEQIGQASRNVQQSRAELMGMKDEGLSKDEFNRIRQDSLDFAKRNAGPDIYEPASRRLKEREEARSKNVSQGQGLALLAAAGAILEGNTLARGASKAFPVFAQQMGEVQRADINEQRSIESMQFSLADAQRKERMGDIRGAQAAAETARKERVDANRFRLNKAQALAKLDSDVYRAVNRPAGKGAGAQPSAFNVLFNAKQALSADPKNPQLQAAVKNAEQSVAATKQSFSIGESGPNRLGAQQEALTSKENIEANKALDKHKLMNGREWRKSVEAAGSVEAAENQFKKKWITNNPQSVEGASSPAKPAAAPKPTATAPATKAVSMADVRATVASSGRTEQEVIDALKAKGYTIK